MAVPAPRARPRTAVPAILAALAIVLGGCGGPGSSPSAPGQSVGAGATFGGEAPALSPEDATDVATGAHDDKLYRALYRDSGVEAEIGAETITAIESLRHELLVALLDDATSGAGERPIALVSTRAEPLFLAVGVDYSGNMGTLTTLVGGQIDGSGRGGTQTSTVDTTFPFQGQQVSLAGNSTTHVTANGSRVSATLQSNITRTVRDANGTVIATSTESTLATMELEACPAADGSLNATYSLEIIVDSGTLSMRHHVTGTVTGTVGDDALLQGFTIDAAGESTATSSGSTVIDRALTIQSVYRTPGGSTTGATATAQPTVTIVRASAMDPASAIGDLAVSAVQPGLRVAASAFARAQEAWRSGACVKIDAGDTARGVEPDESVTFTAKVIHKIEGAEITKPIVAELAGPKSIDPAGVEVISPASFTYVASSTVGDIGIVTLKSTSNRGIGTEDVYFVVEEPLRLEVRIESEIDITELTNFGANAKAKVVGRILLTRDDATDTWSGTGTLTSTTTSNISGCNTISVSGTGSYDWLISEVVASPGLAASDLRINMDSGPDNEQPDSFIARLCPSGALTGNMNTWENLFFQIHRDRYGTKGFLVDTLSTDVPDTSVWADGMELGSFSWFGSCAGTTVEGQTIFLARCDALSTFGIWVVARP